MCRNKVEASATVVLYCAQDTYIMTLQSTYCDLWMLLGKIPEHWSWYPAVEGLRAESILDLARVFITPHSAVNDFEPAPDSPRKSVTVEIRRFIDLISHAVKVDRSRRPLNAAPG